ncbi:histidinol-phosphate transaminase [Nocardioides sp. Bht2]|uniref:histidinol-phosphate transaminase n=1 Tax=Nocardioides sp. Bht2 TaxID=3392297 RepID=UPI0039B43DB6
MATTPMPRASVAEIPPYVPGRTPVSRPGFTSYKLSSNENPYPPLPGVLQAAQGALEQLNRYPDMGNTALYGALASRLGVATDQLALGTGSVGLLFHLVQAFAGPGDEVVHAWRSFEAYPIAIAAAGAKSVAVGLTAAGEHDLEALAEAVTERTRVLIVCTPNNPTGTAVTQTALRTLIERVPPHVLVLVDEAYVEFVRMQDAVDGLALQREFPNVVSLRTFSKAYGLANLRVGYAITTPEIALPLRAVATPFGVSTVAQAAAVASLKAEQALMGRVDALVRERSRVLAGVREAGWQLPDAQGNFCWFPFPGDADATARFVAAAAAVGISVRPFAGEGVRVSVGEQAGNDRVIELARRVADEFGVRSLRS